MRHERDGRLIVETSSATAFWHVQRALSGLLHMRGKIKPARVQSITIVLEDGKNVIQ